MSIENDRQTALIFTPEMGRRFYYARRKIGLTQKKCAALLEMSQASLSKLECGKVKNSHVTIETMKAVFKKHYVYILSGKNPQEYERYYGRLDAGTTRDSWLGKLTMRQQNADAMKQFLDKSKGLTNEEE